MAAKDLSKLSLDELKSALGVGGEGLSAEEARRVAAAGVDAVPMPSIPEMGFVWDAWVNAGTLALGSSGALADSAGITVADGAVLDVSALAGGFALGATQTLSGSGARKGPGVHNGPIAPGATGGMIGTLTLGNPPTLNGTVVIKVNRDNGTPLNDQISLSSSAMTYGGTLTVDGSQFTGGTATSGAGGGGPPRPQNPPLRAGRT